MLNSSNRSPRVKLNWFELESCPCEFRFAVLPKQPVLIGFRSNELAEEQLKPAIYLVSRKTNAAQVEDIVRLLEGLIEKHQVIQTPEHEPQKTFQDQYQTSPSLHVRIALHVRIGYGKRRWQSCYVIGKGALPENLREFIEACYELGVLTVQSARGKSIAGESIRPPAPGSRRPDVL